MRGLRARIERMSGTDWALGVVVMVGIVTRLINLDHSLFVDEAWVANSVLAPSVREMFFYDTWLQTSPPLFLVLVRYTAKVLGTSNVALRVVPSMFGMLSIILMAIVGRRILGGTSAILCTALLVTSTAVYHWALILKQYSSDVFVSLLLIWLILRYLDEPARRGYVLLVCGFVVAMLLSHTALFFVPGALYALLYEGWRARADRRETIARVVVRMTVFVLAMAAEWSVEFTLFIKPNVTPELRYYWFTDFPARFVAGDLARYYVGRSRDLASLLLPDDVRSPARAVMVLGIIGIGILRLGLSADPHARAERHFVRVSALLLMTVVGANLLKQYPYGEERTSLFLFPPMIVSLGAGLEAIRDGIRGRMVRHDPRSRWHVWLPWGCAVAVVMFLFGYVLHYPKPGSEEDAQGAISYVLAKAGGGDAVYVHASMFEQFKFYHGKMVGNAGVAYYYGNTGWRCCTRKTESYYLDREYSRMRDELRSFVTDRNGQRMWFLFINRPGDWYWRDDARFVRNALEGAGCSEMDERTFRGALVYAFQCQA
jgi:4-amino-4-deoxy-L-arabinose transferase-like glycosyltransferase